MLSEKYIILLLDEVCVCVGGERVLLPTGAELDKEFSEVLGIWQQAGWQ